MGHYGVLVDEFIEPFEDFLRSQEGDVSAECVAEAWNELSKKYNWYDTLIVNQKGEVDT